MHSVYGIQKEIIMDTMIMLLKRGERDINEGESKQIIRTINDKFSEIVTLNSTLKKRGVDVMDDTVNTFYTSMMEIMVLVSAVKEPGRVMADNLLRMKEYLEYRIEESKTKLDVL